MTVEQKAHTWIYVLIVVIIVALMAAGVAVRKNEKNNAEAHAKARELIGKFEAAGLKAPEEDTIVELFGTDGGAFAVDPGSSLLQAELAAQYGNPGPASRAVIIDKDLLRAGVIILEVYAPQKLAAYQEFLNGLKFGETQ
jgi:hypothetical protein